MGFCFLLSAFCFSIGEVVDQRAGGGIGLLPELEQLAAGIAGGRGEPQRVVLFVKELAHPGQLADLLEDLDQVAAVGIVLRQAAEEHLVLVARPLQARARPGELGCLHQLVVLQEADEHAAQHPGHRHLGQLLLAPRVVSEGAALFRLGVRVLRFERRVHRRLGIAAFPQVVLQPLDHGGAGAGLALEVGEEFFGVDHFGGKS
jgi:hypothetical protein